MSKKHTPEELNELSHEETGHGHPDHAGTAGCPEREYREAYRVGADR